VSGSPRHGRHTLAILGIVGGIAPPSTIAYYRSIIELYGQATGGRSPRILIDSLDSSAFYALLEADDRDGIVSRVVDELGRLAGAGAELAIIGSNTGHVRFDEIAAASPIPLVSIVDAVADAISDRTRVGLFATTFTVNADIYGPTLARRGIRCVVPAGADQERIQAIYFGELAQGTFKDASRDELLAIAGRLRATEDVDTIILGGTELPLLLTEPERDGITYIDSGRLHAEAAVRRLLELESQPA
jgi:aspartate racemase